MRTLSSVALVVGATTILGEVPVHCGTLSCHDLITSTCRLGIISTSVEEVSVATPFPRAQLHRREQRITVISTLSYKV